MRQSSGRNARSRSSSPAPSGSGGGSTGALRNNPEFAAGVRAIGEQNWQGAPEQMCKAQHPLP